jgi:hypothetical protein
VTRDEERATYDVIYVWRVERHEGIMLSAPFLLVLGVLLVPVSDSAGSVLIRVDEEEYLHVDKWCTLT